VKSSHSPQNLASILLTPVGRVVRVSFGKRCNNGNECPKPKFMFRPACCKQCLSPPTTGAVSCGGVKVNLGPCHPVRARPRFSTSAARLPPGCSPAPEQDGSGHHHRTLSQVLHFFDPVKGLSRCGSARPLLDQDDRFRQRTRPPAIRKFARR
jgi:hypothetical protein